MSAPSFGSGLIVEYFVSSPVALQLLELVVSCRPLQVAVVILREEVLTRF